MKLRDLKGERAVEVIADLIAPIANIASDQKNLKLFQAEKLEGESNQDMAIRDMKEKIPLLLRTHKKDVLDILCAIDNSKKPEEMSPIDIIKGTLDLMNDEDFKSLFLSADSKTEQMPHTGSSAKADHSKPES